MPVLESVEEFDWFVLVTRLAKRNWEWIKN